MTLGERIWIKGDGVALEGSLAVPPAARGVVVFAHGSGSSRHSPRNVRVAEALVERGFATLLFDLLLPAEDMGSPEMRFDVDLLAERLVAAKRWLATDGRTRMLEIAYFGASTGAAAALVAAARDPAHVRAVVSRGGRPDLAAVNLPRVSAPTLFVVGGDDRAILPANQDALALLRCEKRLEIVPGASHLFGEPGTLERVIELSAGWFEAHFPVQTRPPRATAEHDRGRSPW